MLLICQIGCLGVNIKCFSYIKLVNATVSLWYFCITTMLLLPRRHSLYTKISLVWYRVFGVDPRVSSRTPGRKELKLRLKIRLRQAQISAWCKWKASDARLSATHQIGSLDGSQAFFSFSCCKDVFFLCGSLLQMLSRLNFALNIRLLLLQNMLKAAFKNNKKLLVQFMRFDKLGLICDSWLSLFLNLIF